MLNRGLLLTFLFCAVLGMAQDTTPTKSVFHVCGPKYPPSAGPCGTAPKVKYSPDPPYPEAARKEHIEGTVVLWLVVDGDGVPQDIKVARSLRGDLDAAALKTVQNWRFEPATFDGKPVAVQINVEVNFRLNDQKNGSTRAPNASPEITNLAMQAEEASRRGDWPNSLALGRRLVQLNPESGGGWNIIGLALMNTGELDEAVKAFQKEVEVYPANRLTHRYLGIAYMRQEKYPEAVTEFQKQLVIDPEDNYAKGNLGYSYAQEKHCDDAVPNLSAALTRQQNNNNWRVALGQCYLDLNKTKEGVEKLQSAVDQSTSPGTWNDAAYELALHNIDLDRALKWAQTAVTMQSAEMHSASLESVTPVQFGRIRTLITFWDTLGWVYFVRKDYQNAEKYLKAGWLLWQSPTIGEHLAQTYEALNRKDDAARIYAMLIDVLRNSPDGKAKDVAAETEKLQKLLPAGELEAAISKGNIALAKLQTVTVDNKGKLQGDGEFVFSSSGNKVVEARQISGDQSLNVMASALPGNATVAESPDGTTLVFLRRGAMHCHSAQPTCDLSLLSVPDAITQTAVEGTKAAEALPGNTVDRHLYNSANLGMSLTIPDGWQLTGEAQGSLSKPATAIFGKPGAIVMLLLLQEHLEAPPDLYEKIMTQVVERQASKRLGESKVTRDGIAGDHWDLEWTDKGITYRGFLEFYSVGDQHFRIFGGAADDVYQRYAQDFQDILHSVKFPLLRVKAEDLLGTSDKK